MALDAARHAGAPVEVINALIEQRVSRGWPLNPEDRLLNAAREEISVEAEARIFLNLLDERDRRENQH